LWVFLENAFGLGIGFKSFFLIVITMCRSRKIAREIVEEPIEIKDQVTTISTDHRYGQTHSKK
jgi:hypothetical protein